MNIHDYVNNVIGNELSGEITETAGRSREGGYTYLGQ